MPGQPPTMPSRSFLSRVRLLVEEFAEDVKEGRSEPTRDQRHAVHSLKVASEEIESPLLHLEHALHPWVAFFIMPVFALANAGVTLSGGLAETLSSAVTLGIVAGLLIGKQIGVLVFTWLAVRTGLSDLPAGVAWRQIWGVAFLCGIGFTMSLFIAGLALEGDLLTEAKVGILAGSVLSGVAGTIVLLGSGRRTPDTAA